MGPNLNCENANIFFSKYVEGSGNNRALELYNPTNKTINLDGYTIERYANGSETATEENRTTLSKENQINPYSTFVIGLDKRDNEGTGQDAPSFGMIYYNILIYL